jgi:hypothetical protein
MEGWPQLGCPSNLNLNPESRTFSLDRLPGWLDASCQAVGKSPPTSRIPFPLPTLSFFVHHDHNDQSLLIDIQRERARLYMYAYGVRVFFLPFFFSPFSMLADTGVSCAQAFLAVVYIFLPFTVFSLAIFLFFSSYDTRLYITKGKREYLALFIFDS